MKSALFMEDQILKSSIEFFESHQIPYHLVPSELANLGDSALGRRQPDFVKNDINTIIIATNKFPRKYAAFVIPADHKLVGSAARHAFASGKISFADLEELLTVTKMAPGSVTPFALPREVQLFFDENLVELDWGTFGSGNPSWKIVTSPRALFEISGATKLKGLSELCC